MNRILIADDEEINLKIMKRFLSDEPEMEIIFASDGKTVLEKIEEFPPDIVVMDIFMPELSGIEVAKVIRERYQNLQLPIILITASFDFKLKMEALEAGVDDFLNKPLDRIELITKIRLLIKNKRLHEEIEQNNQRMLHQLRLARIIQDKLQFRGHYQFKHLAIEASYFPLDEIGGDIIAIRKIDDQRLWVFLGDAAGHGISAAMVGTLIKALLEGLPNTLETCEVMKQLNNKLVDCFDGDLDDLYVTAVFCVADLEKNTLTWVNAGHPDPFIRFVGNEKQNEMPVQSPYVTHLPLGILRNYAYASNDVSLNDLEEMILYSDGLLSLIKGTLGEAQSCISDDEQIRRIVEQRRCEQEAVYEDDLAIIRIKNTQSKKNENLK